MAAETYGTILVGGGLQNGLIALALARSAPGRRVLLLERSERLGGNHTWCCHERDVGPAGMALLQPLVSHRWPGYSVVFPDRRRWLSEPYVGVTSEGLHGQVSSVFASLPGWELRTGTEVQAIDGKTVVLTGGQRLQAELVVDSRGPESLAAHTASSYQKFVGLEVELERPVSLPGPLLMDATVEQRDGFRFVYTLPFSATRVLVEDTYFSDDPGLDRPALVVRLERYLAERGYRVARVLRQEHGVLPLPLSPVPIGSLGSPLRGGYAGGWFHPVTGYSLPSAMRLALHVAQREPAGVFDDAYLELVARTRAEMRFGCTLNWLSSRGFPPRERYRIFERFYGLPEDTIARFCAMRTGMLDRFRILVGRPPRGFSLKYLVQGGARA